jgi:hypothetical protein
MLKIHNVSISNIRLYANFDYFMLMLSSIYGVHDEAKDKDFELEMSWVCDESNRQHQKVSLNFNCGEKAYCFQINLLILSSPTVTPLRSSLNNLAAHVLHVQCFCN